MSLYLTAQSRKVLLADDAQALDLKSLLKERTGRPGPRRVNRWIQLALLGARDCVRDLELSEETSVLLTTRNGAIGDTLSLLTGNANNQPPAPFQFINVSGNMAAYYLAADLKLVGANQVIVSYELPFFSLLEMAWLNPAEQMLLGAVEELVWPLDVHRQRLHLQPASIVGESSHWALLQREGTGPRIEAIRRCIDDQGAREFISSLPVDQNVHVADPIAAEQLARPMVELQRSDIANPLDDAEQVLAWLEILSEPAWLGLRTASGHWGFIAARGPAE